MVLDIIFFSTLSRHILKLIFNYFKQALCQFCPLFEDANDHSLDARNNLFHLRRIASHTFNFPFVRPSISLAMYI